MAVSDTNFGITTAIQQLMVNFIVKHITNTQTRCTLPSFPILQCALKIFGTKQSIGFWFWKASCVFKCLIWTKMVFETQQESQSKHAMFPLHCNLLPTTQNCLNFKRWPRFQLHSWFVQVSNNCFPFFIIFVRLHFCLSFLQCKLQPVLAFETWCEMQSWANGMWQTVKNDFDFFCEMTHLLFQSSAAQTSKMNIQNGMCWGQGDAIWCGSLVWKVCVTKTQSSNKMFWSIIQSTALICNFCWDTHASNDDLMSVSCILIESHPWLFIDLTFLLHDSAPMKPSKGCQFFNAVCTMMTAEMFCSMLCIVGKWWRQFGQCVNPKIVPGHDGFDQNPHVAWWCEIVILILMLLCGWFFDFIITSVFVGHVWVVHNKESSWTWTHTDKEGLSFMIAEFCPSSTVLKITHDAEIGNENP